MTRIRHTRSQATDSVRHPPPVPRRRRGRQIAPERLIDVVAADPNVISPFEVIGFERTRGERDDLREGDEVLIRMAGRWELIGRMQTHTWAHMLGAGAQLAGGRPPRKIVVETWHT